MSKNSQAGVGPLQRPVRPLVERLRQAAHAMDVNMDAMLMDEAATAIERLIEDRARLPDRPDWVGSMIGSHFDNLRAKADANEEAWRRTQLHADVHVARLRDALEQITRDCTARKAVMIARKALEA